MQTSLYQLLLVDHHVVTQVIKSKFVICNICNIAIVSVTALIVAHIIQYNTNGQSEEFMNFSHPLGISFCQIIIDRDDIYPFALQRIQISRKCRYQCLTFTCLHLCNTSLMQDNTTDNLYSVMLHAKHTACCLTYGRIRFRKQIVKCLSFFQTLLIFFCLSP